VSPRSSTAPVICEPNSFRIPRRQLSQRIRAQAGAHKLNTPIAFLLRNPQGEIARPAAGLALGCVTPPRRNGPFPIKLLPRPRERKAHRFTILPWPPPSRGTFGRGVRKPGATWTRLDGGRGKNRNSVALGALPFRSVATTSARTTSASPRDANASPNTQRILLRSTAAAPPPSPLACRLALHPRQHLN